MKTPPPPPPGDESPEHESEMSFPASDPPSHSQPTLGDGDRATDDGLPETSDEDDRGDPSD